MAECNQDDTFSLYGVKCHRAINSLMHATLTFLCRAKSATTNSVEGRTKGEMIYNKIQASVDL